MDLTYTLRAADGREYGPVTQVQIVAWAHEGRVSAFSELRRSDMEHWAPTSDFEEFKFLFSTSASLPAADAREITSPPPDPKVDPAAVAQLKSGASWFYWIAALSLINSVVALTGSDWRFIFGLGVTQITDAFASEMGAAGKSIMFVINLIIIGILVLFGYLGAKRQLWAFIVGMVLLALDGIIFLLVRDWLGVAFHAFIIYCLFRGMQACRALQTN